MVPAAGGVPPRFTVKIPSINVLDVTVNPLSQDRLDVPLAVALNVPRAFVPLEPGS